MAHLVARDIMSRSLKTVRRTMTVGEAFTMMEREHVRHLLITELSSSMLLGIVSDRDIKRVLSPFLGSRIEAPKDRATAGLALEKIMKRNLITAAPGDSIKSLVEAMLKHSINAIPIIEPDLRVLGIVSSTDLLKELLTLLP